MTPKRVLIVLVQETRPGEVSVISSIVRYFHYSHTYVLCFCV
jgi:hypothetical protein